MTYNEVDALLRALVVHPDVGSVVRIVRALDEGRAGALAAVARLVHRGKVVRNFVELELQPPAARNVDEEDPLRCTYRQLRGWIKCPLRGLYDWTYGCPRARTSR